MLPAPQLPTTPTEQHEVAQLLIDTLPMAFLTDEDAAIVVKHAVFALGEMGCNSLDELRARARQLTEKDLLAPAPELLDALFFVAFRRLPVDGPDRRAMVAAIVAVDGGPEGVDADELPGGTGPFGRSADNPVPVAGIASAPYYLECLRTPDGYPLKARRTGSCGSRISAKPVDRYALTDGEGQPAGEVYLSPYHQRISERAPEGLRLVEW